MHAVIFDIDSTLLRSSEADSDLYAAAIRAVLGDVQLRNSSGDNDRVSDCGILAEVLKDNSIDPTDIRVPRVRAYFIDSLSRHIERHGPFQ
jgi:hypothetical protein